MKFQISPKASDIIICIYAVVTLYFRFSLEATYNVGPVESLIMGLSFVTIAYALIKLKILNPQWFGLLNSKK